jgi:carboxypeptidase T
MTRRPTLTWAASALAAAALFAHTPSAAQTRAHGITSIYDLMEQEKATTNLYKAYFPSREIGRRAAISFHAQLLETDWSAGFMVFELQPHELDALRLFGFRFEPATEFINRRNAALTQAQIRLSSRAGLAEPLSIPGYACYETVEETFAAADALIAAQPTLGSWVDAGDSWLKTQGAGGWDMRVLKLTNSATTGVGGADKPKLFITSAIHAREYTTAPLSLEFARWLVNGYGTNADATWILDHHEVHLMLHTNPDGRKRAETGLSWRKNVNNNFCANTNNRGIDLNRNFSYGWNSTGGTGSSGNACDLTYRGPGAASEPETQAVQNYARSIWTDRRGPGLNDAAPADTSGIHIDLHSFSQLVLWPWGTTNTPAPNGVALQTLGRKFAFFNGYQPTQSIGLYVTDGTSDGASYGDLGVANYTFELGTSFFQSCSVYENTIRPSNLPALIYAAKVVRTPYQTPAGPDVTALALAGTASTTGVPMGSGVTIDTTLSDARFNNTNGVEPTQAVAEVQAFIDVPPWLPGAVPIALVASDGSFNSTVEAATGTLSTAGLSLGRHTVYVRGRDAAGNWGAVSAVFLNVIAMPEIFEIEPNNNLNQTFNVPSLPMRVRGTMSNSKEVELKDRDVYTVTVPAGKTLTAVMTPNAALNANLQIYSSSGSLLVDATAGGIGQPETGSVTNVSAAPAIYKIRIWWFAGGNGPINGTYTLDLTAP